MKRWWLLSVALSVVAFLVALPLHQWAPILGRGLGHGFAGMSATTLAHATLTGLLVVLGVCLALLARRSGRTPPAADVGTAILAHEEVILFVTDRAGKIAVWSRGCERLFGYKAEQALGMNVRQLFAQSAAADVGALLRQGAAGDTASRDLSAQTRDGAGPDVFVCVCRYGDDAPDQLLWHGVDITGRKGLERIVRQVLDAGYGRDAAQFLQFLTEQLACTLGTRLAFVAETRHHDPSAHMIALWDGNHFEPPFDYLLTDTPCAELRERDSICYADGVAERYQKDSFLREHHVRAYMAVALFDSRGRVVGHMGVMDDRPITDIDHCTTVLRLFSARAAAGLERMHNDEANRRRIALETLMSDVSSGFVGVQDEEFDQKVHAALQRLGEFAGVERCHLYRLSSDQLRATLTHLWSSVGTEPVPESYRTVRIADFPWHWQELQRRGFVLVADVNELPASAHAEQAELRRGGVRSMLNVGMYDGGRLTGFLGFESLHDIGRWPAGDLRLLRVVGEVLANSFERRRKKEALRKLSGALDQTADAVMITNRDGVIEYINPAFSQITGYDRDEMLGQHPSVLNSDQHEQSFYDDLWKRVSRGEVFRGTLVNRRKDGTLYHEQTTITPLKDSHGTISHFIYTGRDISESVRNQERLLYLAHHDTLTDLPNRSLFMDRTQHAIARAHRSDSQMALLFLDLDGFKEINDSLGHDAGDQMLRMVADRLRAAMRQGDTVSRLGGDEFTILLEGIEQLEDAAAVARKIIDSLGKPYSIAQCVRRISASIGISMYPRDGDRPESLLSKADKAMFQAKRKSSGGHYEFADSA